MKRLTLLAIVLTGFAVFSLGQYGSRSSPRKVYQLTEPKLTGPVSFEQVLVKRRSMRAFADLPLNRVQIGQLAWAGQGITDRERGFRTAPSAGAIYPIELYFATKDGIFVYSSDDHSLERTSDQDLRGRLASAVSEPEVVAGAACDIILAGSVRKLAVKYGKQARRYLLLEAGHIAQNIQLQATSLELGSVSIA
ncbi:MAG: SagB/ThcOx family dehydrogenase, partial [Planctomycetota bacterium]